MAFSKVKAPANAAQKALARAEEKKTRRRISRRAIAVAAMAVLLTASAFAAEIDSGAVSNFFAPLFGGAQSELVDSIGYPINARVAIGEDYTLSADAVVGDRNSMYVVYTLRRNDGAPVERYLGFEEWDSSVYSNMTGGASREALFDEDGVYHILESCTVTGPILGHYTTVTVEDLFLFDPETGERTVIEEGTWKLGFALRYQDTSVELPVKGLVVTDADGNGYTVQKCTVSALGLSLKLNAQPAVEEGFEFDKTFSAAVYRKDAAEMGTDGAVGTYTTDIGWTGSGNMDYILQFKQPCPVEEIGWIDICGTVVPVN